MTLLNQLVPNGSLQSSAMLAKIRTIEYEVLVGKKFVEIIIAGLHRLRSHYFLKCTTQITQHIVRISWSRRNSRVGRKRTAHTLANKFSFHLPLTSIVWQFFACTAAYPFALCRSNRRMVRTAFPRPVIPAALVHLRIRWHRFLRGNCLGKLSRRTLNP